MSSVTRITEGSRRKPKVKQIAASDIHVDPEVQRDVIPARVKALADKMDLDAIGIITVSDRGGKGMVALDGQHRLAALEQIGMGEWEVTCLVYSGLDTNQEAALFRRLNDTRKITPYDDFSKGLVEGDETCVAINEIVEKHGLHVTAGGGRDGSVSCVNKLRQVYGINGVAPVGEILDRTLEDSTEAWGIRYSAVDKSIIGGLAIVHTTYADEIDRPTLVKKLAKYKGGSSALIGTARLLKDLRSAPLDRVVASVIVETYNRGRRSGQLDAL
jgi:hypothetical protein